MNNKLILLVGPPASGKTTWARNYKQENPDTVIVGRDKLREMLFGYSESTVQAHYEREDFGQREHEVTQLQHSIIRTALAEGKTVVVDDTNLDLKRLEKWRRDYERYTIRLELMNVSREQCIVWNESRTRVVPYEAMNTYYDRYLSFCEKSIARDYPAKRPTVYEPDPFQNSAFVFDLDGTMANIAHRKPFGCTDAEILADQPIEPVVNFARMLLNQGFSLVFLSGREDKHYVATLKWLEFCVGPTHNWVLYMRATGDYRRDSIIKQELFDSHVAPKYNVKAVFDDRKQVKQMWVDKGLFVFDCNQNDAWF